MKKLIIEMTYEQYNQITKEITNSFEKKIKKETTTEIKYILSIGGGLAWLDFEGNKKIDLGELTYKIV